MAKDSQAKKADKKKSNVVDEEDDDQSDKPEGYVFGRPTKYKKEFCQELVEHMSAGYSQVAFAGKIGISEDTFYEWAKVHDDFSEALKIGKAISQAHWEKLGLESMVLPKQLNFAQGAYAFTMKNRFKWHDNKEVDVNVKTIKFGYNPEDK